MLLGLVTGVVLKLFVDTPFPLTLFKGPTSTATSTVAPSSSAVTCVETSLYRDLLVSVSAAHLLSVVELKSQELLFSKPGVLSACFNSEINDLVSTLVIFPSLFSLQPLLTPIPHPSPFPFPCLPIPFFKMCYTSIEGVVYVVSGLSSKAFPPKAAASAGGAVPSSASQPQEQVQFVSGHAVSFQSQKIYTLHRGTVVGADVPQSSNMVRALEAGDVSGAYRVACLGATEADWKLLAIRSLRANNIGVAKSSFARLKDTKYLNLLEAIERGEHASTSSSSSSSSSVDNKALSSVNTDPVAVASKGRTRDRRGPDESGSTGPSVVPPKEKEKELLSAAWQAELLAYEGHHLEAAKTFARVGSVDEAIRLFTDLRRCVCVWYQEGVRAVRWGKSGVINYFIFNVLNGC